MKLILNLIAAILILTLGSCNQSKSYLIDGNYEGVYMPSSPNARYAAVPVKFYFNGEKETFTGSASSTYYETICSGTYKISDDKVLITFAPTCSPSDNTLVLNGTYSLEIDGNKLSFDQEYEPSSYFSYRLTKVTDKKN